MATPAQWIQGARPRTLPTAVSPVVVGTAAQRAGVPVECVSDGWLRIGVGQFLPVAAVKVPSTIARCGSAAGSQ